MIGRQQRNLYGGWGMIAFMLAPALLLLGLFVFYPAVNALWVSLSSWSGFAPQSQFIWFDNFSNLLFHDPRFWASFLHTLFYVLVGGIVHFTFALLFAWALSHPQLAGKKVYQTLVFFPAFISVVGVATLWARLYDPKDGLLNRLIEALHHTGITWLAPDNAMRAIIVASVWAGVGGQMILLLAGMRRIPSSIYEAARIDGASETQVFWRITFPLLRDVTYIALSLWLIESMQVFGLMQALAGPDLPLELETVSTYQYSISFNARDNIYMMGRGTAMAVVLVAVILLMAGVTRLFFSRRDIEY
jgi:ABC-type sugar transport system permease subunit